MKAFCSAINRLQYCFKLHYAKIIDQNAFRDSQGVELESHLRKGGWVVLTDVAIAEMLKSTDHWKTILTNSTKIIGKYPDHVFVINGVGRTLRDEQSQSKPIGMRLTDMVADDITQIFREHLKTMDKETDELMEKLEANISNAQAIGNRQYFDGVFNKEQLVNWIETWREVGGKNGEKELRESPDKWDFLSGVLANVNFQHIVFNVLKDIDMDESTAKILSVQGSLFHALIVVNQLIALKWLAFGGIESATDKTITNEMADADYIAHALLFGGIVTYDKSVLKLYHIISPMFQKLRCLRIFKYCLTHVATDAKRR